MRRDKGFEVEVTDPKTEEQESEASEGEYKRVLQLGVQCGRWGVDKRTVWGLFTTIQRSYILIQGGLYVAEVSPLGQA